MSSNHLTTLILAGALAGAWTGGASTTERDARLSDYKSISARNPFNLRPPDPPKVEKAAAAAPKSEIFLTGISTLVPPKRAFLKTKDPSAKEEQNYSLAVSESKDGLEVLEIDEVGKKVRIRNGGIETLLSFATHGIKPPAAPPAPAAPGGNRGAPGALPLPPGGAQAANRMSASVPGAYSPNPAANNAAIYGAGAPRDNTIRSIPTRNIRTQPLPETTGVNWSGAGAIQATPLQDRYNRSQVVQHQFPDNPPLSAEEQVLMLELQRTANPDLPPTPGIGLPLPPVPGQ